MIAAALILAAQEPSALRVVQTLTPPEEAVDFVPVRGGGEPGAGAVLSIGRDGQVRAFVADASGARPFADAPREGPRWPAPERRLFAVGALAGGAAGDELLTLGPDGCVAHPLDASGVPAVEGDTLAGRARFDLRVGAPQASPFLVDLDGDGHGEVLVPEVGKVSLWEVEAGEGEGEDGEGTRRLRRRLAVAVAPSVRASLDADDLTDVLVAEVELPGLATLDLTGDGRDDLVVSAGQTRAFHLARADGGLSAEPDVLLDLALFRDGAGARDGFEPGQILSRGGEAELRTRDVDGDGVPDHVIFAGRKLWVFRAGPAGPQFAEPSTILKSAEDISYPLLVAVDDDSLPDLVLLRLRLPSIATLVLGLVRSFDVELRASAYRNLGGGRFEQRPSADGGIELRVPPILGLLRDPAAVVERFTGLARDVGQVSTGDLDGDGSDDLLRLTTDDDGRAHLELWSGADAGRIELTREELDGVVRETLFGADDRVWDLDRVVSFLGSQGAARVLRATGGAEPDARLTLPAGLGPGTRLRVARGVDGRDRVVVFDPRSATERGAPVVELVRP